MYKLISLLFLLLIIVAGSAKTMDLSIDQAGVSLKYEFPRFAEKSWFEFEWDSRTGNTRVRNNL